MTITPGGLVGIGTSSPQVLLDVESTNGTALQAAGTGCSGAVVTFGGKSGFAPTCNVVLDLQFNDSNTSVGDFITGEGPSGAHFVISKDAVVHASGGFDGTCRTDGFISNGPICDQDFAEAYASSEPTEAGELVALVPGSKATVRRSAGPYDRLLAGVVSTSPGLVFDNGKTHLAGDNSQLITKDKTLVALVGRVPIKVSMENGPIEVGDPITSSSKPGVGMRATEAGKIAGYALEPTEKDGTVLAYVQLGYYSAPAIAALRARAQRQDREVHALRQENAQLRQQLQSVLIQLKDVRNQVEAVSANTMMKAARRKPAVPAKSVAAETK